MRKLSFKVTDLHSYSLKSYVVRLDDDQIGCFARNVAEDLAGTIPVIKRRGMCVALYDEEGRRILVTPLDPIQ